MAIDLRVLILDSNQADAELTVNELRRVGYDPTWRRVETEQDFLAHLDPTLDVILSEYALPQFDALRALQVMRGRKLDIPFILVTGNASEDVAAATLQQGAADYLRKDRLARLGSAVTNVLDHRRLDGEWRRANQALGVMATLSGGLRNAQTHDEMVSLVLDQLLDFLSAGAAAVDLRDSANGEVSVDLARGAWSHETGQPIPPGQGISSQVISTGQTFTSENGGSDLRLDPLATVAGIRAVAYVPLIARGRTIGVLRVGREVSISDEELRLMKAFADMAASAIHSSILFGQAEQRHKNLVALHAISLAISSSLDLHFTIDLLLDQVIKQLSVDAADILLLDPHTHTLNWGAGRGFRSKSIERTALLLGQGYAGQAALERRMVSVPDLSSAEPELPRSALLTEEGFQAYYAVPLIAKGSVKGVLEIFQRSPVVPGSDWLDFLEILGVQAAIAIDIAQLFEELQRSNINQSMAYDASIEGWSRALELRHLGAEGHTQRIAEITVDLARAMGVSEADLIDIRRGALLHDIGTLGVPDHILLKAGPLDDQESLIMRQHPVYAYELLAPITFLRRALDIPYCHHERWDGTGYPRRLKGEQIPLAARIFAVVDVWDALRSDRPYRRAWPDSEVWEYLTEQAGREFDPQVVKAFLERTPTDPPAD